LAPPLFDFSRKKGRCCQTLRPDNRAVSFFLTIIFYHVGFFIFVNLTENKKGYNHGHNSLDCILFSFFFILVKTDIISDV